MIVKSIDLDIWTPEQMEVCQPMFPGWARDSVSWSPLDIRGRGSIADLQNIQKWGNKRANLYWEKHLKVGHVPPDQYVLSFPTLP